ncbi:unnamed protein product [Chrysoparadoxa australica]
MLVLDGALQCAEKDEAGYHELITHVAVCRKGISGGSRKRALIIGGGDGGAARELLRHDDVESVELIDIDGEVMKAAKEMLPSIWKHPGSSSEGKYKLMDDDPRFKIRVENGLDFVMQKATGASAGGDGGYDIIVVDASDPVGPGKALYSTDFYGALKKCLRPGGAVTVQGGSFVYLPLVFRVVHAGLSAVFPIVKAYSCHTQIYPGGVWNLHCATLGDDPAEVDEDKAEALAKDHQLKYYSAGVHRASFVLPPIAQAELRKPAPSLDECSTHLEGIMTGNVKAGTKL